MTRLFTDDGDAIPVTVVDVSNNRVTQIKTPETDGYSAVQVTFGKRRASRVNKAAAGPFRQGGVEAGHVLQGIPRHARAACQPEGRRHDRRRHLQGRPECRRDRHAHRQRLCRRDQAPPLLLQPRQPRQLGVAQQAGLDRHGAGSGPRVSRQEDVRPSGRRATHRAESRDRAHRRRAPVAADQGRGSRLRRRRRHGRPRCKSRRASEAGCKPAAKAGNNGTQTDRSNRARPPPTWRRPTPCSDASTTRRWCTRS